MPTGGARHGRRDNGLSAAQYAVVGDVDPRVGEHLLDVLACAGIAAYLQPASDLHPVTRTTTLPDRPTDRLFADREHLHTAREYLYQTGTPASLGDSPDLRDSDLTEPLNLEPLNLEPLDIEAAWEIIVARFDEEADPPESAGLPGKADPPGKDDTRPAGPRLADARWLLSDTPGPIVDADLAALAAGDDDDDGYTPPPPPPVPRPSGSTVLGILAVIGGLWVFFSPDLLPVDGNLALLIGFSTLVTGVAVLIWRLRPDGDEEGNHDDGAVV